MRLKDVSILNPAYQGDAIDTEVSFVPMESLRYGKIDFQEIPFSEGKGKYTFFANGDLLIAKVTPCFENGNIAIANDMKEGIGFGSSEIFVLRMDKSVLNTYMFYFVQTSKFQDAACATMCGVGGLKRISPLFMRTYELSIPTLSVQQKIVDYLDEKTSAIDTQVELLEKKKDAYARLKKAMINRAVTRGLDEHVKLKDSGVEWIGMIPEHWEVKRGKDIGKITHGVSFTPDDLREENDGVLIMRASNIQNGQLSYYDKVYVSSELIPRSKLLKKNDIIICGTNGSLELVGKSTIIKDDINASYGSFMLRFQTSQNASFIHLQLSQLVEMYRGLFATTTINQLTISQFQSFLFSLPPLSEQQAIATYLDEKCTKIDAAIANIDKQTDALKRLKRSLINEVITGQRAV